MQRLFILSGAVVALMLFGLAGCGGSSSSNSSSPIPTGIAVTVTPTTAVIALNGTTQLHASISGTSNTGVQWHVVEDGGGTVTGNGATATYTPPSTPGQYHVTAVSMADGTKYGVAAISVIGQIVINPATPQLTLNQPQTFTASAAGASNLSFNWSVSESGGGSITSGGKYTAPSAKGTYHVVATCAANPALKTSTAVNVMASSAQITILGPTVRRMTPTAAKSISVAVSGPYGFTTSHVITAPAPGSSSLVTFNPVPLGRLTFTATAYALDNAQGSQLSVGSVTATAIPTVPITNLTLDMSSTITKLEIAPANPMVQVGGTLQLAATAKNASGTVVSPANIRWSAPAGSSAAVDPISGIVTGVSTGQAVITATETESGEKQTVTVNVSNVVGIAVTPHTTTINAGSSTQLTAAVSGTSNTAVTWMLSGSSGGTLTPNGTTANFTAPAAPGTFYLKATSVADDTKSDTATITVIVPAKAPIAAFTVNPPSGDATTSFQFDASGSSDPNNSTLPLLYRWDWDGDGNYDTEYSTSSTASNLFRLAGTYTVVLEVKNAAGRMTTTTKTVKVGIGLSVSPPAPTLTIGQTQTFLANVTGSTNKQVTWTVTESNGGIITSAGVYTAPSQPGTYHVTATSQADNSVTATATITVQSTGGTVVVE